MNVRLTLAVVLIVVTRPVRGSDGIVIWRDPGAVETLDLAAGAGGAAQKPRPPFVFEKELLSGVTPKLKVKDAAGRSWAVKWGDEAHAEILASRIVWAAGYFTIPVYFVPEGEISGAHGLERAGKYLRHGKFKQAAFQLWEEDLLNTNGWSWTDNPFVARVPESRQLNGLKILMMLTSNWDNKDAKDFLRGSNTAVLKVSDEGETRYHYLVIDWGGAMGNWGGIFGHSKWDCGGYLEQSPAFIRSVQDGKIAWGYRPAQYTEDIVGGITVEDARWLMQYLGKVTDRQLMDAANGAGATPEQAACYTKAIRLRIEQLRKI